MPEVVVTMLELFRPAEPVVNDEIDVILRVGPGPLITFFMHSVYRTEGEVATAFTGSRN